MSQATLTGPARVIVLAVDRLAVWLGRHWLALFNVLYGTYVLAPFLAPILMQAGATGPANDIYTAYSFVCHQLPERSIFLFGSKPMYSFDEVKAVWPEDGFLGLRRFVGTPEFGYKIAWSDRMMSFYGSLWIGGLLFALFRKRLKSLSPVLWLFLGILPVGIDGVTHMLNDLLAGTSGLGFRDTNAWLQFLTADALPRWFYVGDAFGSFNSDVRWITGFLFGLTTVWFMFPYIDAAMKDMWIQAQAQVQRAAEQARSLHG